MSSRAKERLLYLTAATSMAVLFVTTALAAMVK
jgi:hypothetical protein